MTFSNTFCWICVHLWRYGFFMAPVNHATVCLFVVFCKNLQVHHLMFQCSNRLWDDFPSPFLIFASPTFEIGIYAPLPGDFNGALQVLLLLVPLSRTISKFFAWLFEAWPCNPTMQSRARNRCSSLNLFACSYTTVDYKLEQYFTLTPNQPVVNNPRSFTTKRTG